MDDVTRDTSEPNTDTTGTNDRTVCPSAQTPVVSPDALLLVLAGGKYQLKRLRGSKVLVVKDAA